MPGFATARFLILSLALTAALAVSAPPVVAQQYTFTKIADSAVNDIDPFSTGAPSISDMGHVAFSAMSADPSISRVFRSGPGLSLPLTAIGDDSINTEIGSFMNRVSVNNSGQVVVWATTSGLPGVFERIVRGSGPAASGLTTIAQASSTGQFNFMSVITSINDSGLAAWQGELNQSGFPQGLFIGSGGAANIIFSTAASMFTSSFAGPAINNAGQIAFRASTATSGGDAIFRYNSGTSFTTIVDGSGPYSTAFDQNPAINNSGRVAVIGRSDDLNTMFLLVGDGTVPVTPVASTKGDLESIGTAAINDSNQVAFSALLDDFTTQAIFASPGAPRALGTITPVIKTGDPLDGSKVTFLSMFREGLNNAGQIAFFAQLADGRGVIMVAAPVACQGDINDSGTVDVNDLLAVITAWGPCVNCPAVPCVPDIAPAQGPGGGAGDCVIDVNDLLAVVTHWGACP